MKPLNVLFLCTGNSARSILAEAYLNAAGNGRFSAHSAGSQPARKVNPFAIELLQKHQLPTAGLRAKSWDEFASKPLDIILTVCDSAAAETCPVWPGRPLTAHWGVADPAAVAGSAAERRKAFMRAFTELRRRIDLMLALPIEKLDRGALKQRLDEIGKISSATPTR